MTTVSGMQNFPLWQMLLSGNQTATTRSSSATTDNGGNTANTFNSSNMDINSILDIVFGGFLGNGATTAEITEELTLAGDSPPPAYDDETIRDTDVMAQLIFDADEATRFDRNGDGILTKAELDAVGKKDTGVIAVQTKELDEQQEAIENDLATLEQQIGTFTIINLIFNIFTGQDLLGGILEGLNAQQAELQRELDHVEFSRTGVENMETLHKFLSTKTGNALNLNVIAKGDGIYGGADKADNLKEFTRRDLRVVPGFVEGDGEPENPNAISNKDLAEANKVK